MFSLRTIAFSGNFVKFKNRATGLYIDGLGRTNNGSDLCQWKKTNHANQEWKITTLANSQNAPGILSASESKRLLKGIRLG
jgi:hypothetical protein